MLFLIVFLCCLAFCYFLRSPIYKYPIAFYAVAIAITAVYFAHAFGVFTLPRQIWLVFFELMQESTLSLALFMVVMFVGVVNRRSSLGAKLRGVRGEVSIIAWILMLGHVVFYMVRWAPSALNSASTNPSAYVSFAVAILLLILLAVLGVTSFKVVKKKMSKDLWSKVQKFSYLFVALIYVHLLCILLPSAMAGGAAAIESVVVYTLVFLAYAVARCVRWRLDAKAAAEKAGEQEPED